MPAALLCWLHNWLLSLFSPFIAGAHAEEGSGQVRPLSSVHCKTACYSLLPFIAGALAEEGAGQVPARHQQAVGGGAGVRADADGGGNPGHGQARPQSRWAAAEIWNAWEWLESLACWNTA